MLILLSSLVINIINNHFYINNDTYTITILLQGCDSMCFKEIYNKVQECLNYDIYELLKIENIDIVRDNDLTYGRKAVLMSYNGFTIIFLKEGLDDQEERNLILHELGHYYFDKRCFLSNKRTEENNANLFMCLYFFLVVDSSVFLWLSILQKD